MTDFLKTIETKAGKIHLAMFPSDFGKEKAFKTVIKYLSKSQITILGGNFKTYFLYKNTLSK